MSRMLVSKSSSLLSSLVFKREAARLYWFCCLCCTAELVECLDELEVVCCGGEKTEARLGRAAPGLDCVAGLLACVAVERLRRYSDTSFATSSSLLEVLRATSCEGGLAKECCCFSEVRPLPEAKLRLKA